MEKLIVLGTGHAFVTKCYNTCFAISNGKENILVDAGGGNGIIGILQKAQIPVTDIHNAFVTHRHTDHLLGMVWVIRSIASLILTDRYDGTFKIYCHIELVNNILALTDATLDKELTDLIGKRIILIPVADGQKEILAGYEVTFFDIHSTKAKQFGFTTKINNGKTLTFLGDEPYNSLCKEYVENIDWLLSEAFCLYSEREIFKPYEKNHSTVKEACELATKLNIKNIVLWHTEDKNIEQRKQLYTTEGKIYYNGNIFVPNDLEVIEL
ncbi:MBL fold metallo-hydrolase [Desulfosporosinus nitroreducens]|uniref:MBL fold metallo-hydrolase n=1 Tax=Desulfosporosinus nitroreducens TaxID=2018668 RepID=A0ABT8QWJ0_9FIRM|nr:MBL fold metallo-hydrolase [Desulfosporosinus nitroreducens]MCO1602059.1 MBL fold metallo-hydrolase [Desulfosporosinus nitroreducens]MDO0825710.1 MBL fold metallo-hydrolase [Desulfosporosinus nitroreducens]